MAIRIAVLVAAALPAPLAAQALAVAPTIVEIPAGKRGAVVEITNTAATALDIQVRPFEWRQVDGRDVLTDGTTLILTPAAATIAPGAKQVLRILAPTAARDREAEWRLIVDQLPRPGGSGLQIRLRLSIPVFAAGRSDDAADLRWRVADGRIEARNGGSRFARLDHLALRDAGGGTTPLATGTTPYLLPGTARTWRLAPGARPVAVAGTIGVHDFVVPLPLAASP